VRPFRTKRNHNNDEYCRLLERINQWQEDHPGQRIPAKWQAKLRQISKRYAARPRGQKE